MHLGSLESTRATLTLPSCSPNFPRASITRYTHAKHEPILNSTMNSTRPWKFSYKQAGLKKIVSRRFCFVFQIFQLAFMAYISKFKIIQLIFELARGKNFSGEQ